MTYQQKTRGLALEWWRGLSIELQDKATEEYLTGRRSASLTGREIETIWNCMINWDHTIIKFHPNN